MGQQNNKGTHLGKYDPNKGEGTGKNPHSFANLQHMASKSLATNGEEEKEKKLAPPPSHSHARARREDVRVHCLTATQADKRTARHHHSLGSRIHSENQIVLRDLRVGKLPEKREHSKPQSVRREPWGNS